MIVSSLEQARDAVRTAGETPAGAAALTLISEPEASARLGVLGWLALFDEARRGAAPGTGPDLLDCGPRAGHVLAALRLGARGIVFRGDAERARRLSEIAVAKGAVLLRETPEAIDADTAPDWRNALIAQLAGDQARPLPEGSRKGNGEP